MIGNLIRRRGPEILEIRVHGVQNTPPAEMLETTPDKVERSLGDELGSFWRRVDDRPDHGISATEAFSWGAQARTGGGGALAATGRAFVQVGWLLLLPFALANLAYWTRHIGEQTTAGSKSWDGAAGAAPVRIFGLLLTLIAVAAFSSVAVDLIAIQCFKDGTQVCAALPSVFDGLRGLDRDSRAALLGILPILAIVVLYAIGRSGRVYFEERVKKFGAELGNTPTEEGRPLLATRGFWSISRVGQTTEWLHVAASVTLVLMLLALDAAYVDVKGCFRDGASTIKWDCIAAGWEHQLPAWFVIGGFALMVAIVTLVGLASHTDDNPKGLVKVVDQMSRRKVESGGSVADSDASTPQTELEPGKASDIRTAWKRGAAMACLILSIAGYLAWTILAFTQVTPHGSDGPGFVGLIVTPIVLVVLAIFLALAGIGWRAATRRRFSRWVSGALLTLGATALLLSHVAYWEGEWRWAFIGLAVICIVAHLFVASLTTRDERDKDLPTTGDNRVGAARRKPINYRDEAWRGRGPAVVMILALFTSMALSSLLVLGAASWLGRPVEQVPEEGIYRTPAAPVTDEIWNTPDAYERFAVLLTVITALMIVLLLLAVAANLLRFIRFSLPELTPADDYKTAAAVGGVDVPDSKYPSRLIYPDVRVRRRSIVRRSSHMLHRGEPLFGWLAVFAAVGFLSLSSSTVYGAIRQWVSAIGESLDIVSLTTDIRHASTAVLVAVAAAAVAAVAVQAASSSERPLGVFWDVVAFFPRAGHPFAPPCFGERVVPELAARTKGWVNDPAAKRPRSVIFTAHSMGSTISAATLLAMRGDPVTAELSKGPSKGDDLVDRTALLSYGTQLRAYFSRFFPAVFGAEKVLGVPGLRGPSLWFGDPWRNQVRDEFAPDSELPEPKQGADLTLTAILGAKGQRVPRWRSLWRRTDFLGFPVYGYRDLGNPVDRGASESAPGTYLWRIATHGDYLGTAQFLRVRDELVKALGGDPH